jgi:hypothetical protein
LLVEDITYAEHHAVTPCFNENSFVIILIKNVLTFDEFQKTTLDLSTWVCDVIELLDKRGGVNVQAKDLAEAGSFGRGKFGDRVIQASPRN